MNMQILKKQAHRKPLDSSATGFTLIEIAIVLFIFGLILTAGLKLLQARANNRLKTFCHPRFTREISGGKQQVAMP
jgi:prepilin-type N-terminal cleavage/methylation domain-containing protein